MTEYYISDPGDEQGAIFDYFSFHPSAAIVYNHMEYVDETEEE